jgi:hypothetical protein
VFANFLLDHRIDGLGGHKKGARVWEKNQRACIPPRDNLKKPSNHNISLVLDQVTDPLMLQKHTDLLICCHFEKDKWC